MDTEEHSSGGPLARPADGSPAGDTGRAAAAGSQGERTPSRERLAGSNRDPVPGAERLGQSDPAAVVVFDVILRRSTTAADCARQSTRAARLRAAGASEEDLSRVEQILRSAGFTVDSVQPATRTLSVHGSVHDVEAFFGVHLADYQAGAARFRGREGHLHLPAELTGIVEAVLGIDDRPQVHPHSRLSKVQPPHIGDAGAQARPPEVPAPPRPIQGAVWVPDVCRQYGFPPPGGQGEAIALIELGGGYQENDIQEYFDAIQSVRPQVVTADIGGPGNVPGSSADQEVALDLQIAGSVAPRAKLVVYFADPSDRGFVAALAAAVHDTEHAPSVVSISWGAYEDSWTPQARKAVELILEDAKAVGTTVLASAGDHGAGDRAHDGQPHVDFPASHPLVVGCGGTSTATAGAGGSALMAWNNRDGWATGGGVSRVYGRPTWQQVAVPSLVGEPSASPGRGVPDIAGHADVQQGYGVRLDGHWSVIGGNSAVAPLYAGLIACINAALGQPSGPLNEVLYALPEQARAAVFTDVTEGDNSVPASQYGPAVTGYTATPGWDACTGFGVLNGAELLIRMQASNRSKIDR